MARGAVGPPTAFSRAVVANIERLKVGAGLSNNALSDAANIGRGYFHSRMRLELPFNTNDLERLARVLGVTPAELTRPVDVAPHDYVRVDRRLVRDRIGRLVGTDANSPTFRDDLARAQIELRDETWAAFASDELYVSLPVALLTAVAERFEVPPSYLLESKVDELSDRVEAELDLRDAMSRVGARTLHARALGDVSPSALRAIARALDADDSSPR